MKRTSYLMPLFAAAALAACSEPERVALSVGGPETEVVIQGDAPTDLAAYAFRREAGRFLFDTLFREGWTAEGTLSVGMRGGSYKFLFVSGQGSNLALQPAPQRGQTTWEEAAFVLRQSETAPGLWLAADELFLQSPAAEAEQVYTLAGERQTIRARLTRAVGRIDVVVKRGYHDGTRYVEEPYGAPQTVLDVIARIDLRVSGVGTSITPSGSRGSGAVEASFAAADRMELTDEGFARFEGPFVLPPADGGEVAIDVSVVPAEGAPLQPKTVAVPGKVERNKQLEVTLWIVSDYPAIGVEIRTAPIGEEQEGDSGIWE